MWWIGDAINARQEGEIKYWGKSVPGKGVSEMIAAFLSAIVLILVYEVTRAIWNHFKR